MGGIVNSKDNGRLLITMAYLVIIFIQISSAARELNSGSTSFEVQHFLKRLNKHPLLSIHSLNGDIIDCIPITEQLAFDHPLLKNHIIQMSPSFEAKKVSESSNWVGQLWDTMNETCPNGSVPIRRTKEEDLLRANSLQDFGKKKLSPSLYRNTSSSAVPASPPSNHEYAIIEVKGAKYHGAKATMNVWQPEVEQTNEFSVSQLWLVTGSYQANNINSIEAGWQVNPSVYGDRLPRLFIYWTKDTYQHSGCHNLLCPGFVQVSKKTVLGMALSPVSVYGGSQYDITIRVVKDSNTGNWWLNFQGDDVGYWPASLFTNLADAAEVVQFGGEVINDAANGKHTATDMGSGHFAEEGLGKASFFKDLQIVDDANNFKNPTGVGINVGHPNCYTLNTNINPPGMGAHFFYGGPGNSPTCP